VDPLLASLDTWSEMMDISLEGGQVAWSDDDEVACSIFPTSTEFKSRYRRTPSSLGKGGEISEVFNIVGGSTSARDRCETHRPASLASGGGINSVGKLIDSSVLVISFHGEVPVVSSDVCNRTSPLLQKVVDSSCHVRAADCVSCDEGNIRARTKRSAKAIKAKSSKLILAVGIEVNSDKVQCLVDYALIGRMEHVKISAVTLRAWLTATWKPLLGYTPFTHQTPLARPFSNFKTVP